MQSAKKLVLVDEYDREYKRVHRPAVDAAKTAKSLQLKDILRDRSLLDDRKVREYVATLHKYLNVRKDVPSEPEVQSNPLSEPPFTGGRQQRRVRRTRRQRWVPY